VKYPLNRYINSRRLTMNKPKMIMFDYGQTLVREDGIFDAIAGTKAVLKQATKNPYQISAKEVQNLANQLNREIGRYDTDVRKAPYIEVHNHLFQNYLYQYYDIEFTISAKEIEAIFWDHAVNRKTTEHIEELLDFLKKEGIRTAVISNISFSGEALKERINSLLPDNHFEFILATSEYVFRKPHRRIFELALRKAKLNQGEVWYCGDNAYYDVEGASKAGIYPVWYRGAIEPGNKLKPEVDCLTIDDWRELINSVLSD
jgi:putative hydrolase of the HAD superfamily